MGSSSRPSSFLDSARRRRNQRTGQPRGHARMIRLTATRVVLAPGADPTELWLDRPHGRAQCWALDKSTAISEQSAAQIADYAGQMHHEPRGRRAIDDPVVVRKRHRNHQARYELAAVPDRL